MGFEGAISPRKLRGAFGEQAALAAFEHHRETYVTDDDIAAILAAGYSRVRLPVTWACFAARDGDPATLLRDPAHPEISHVTVPKEKMTEYLSRLTRAGLKVLIDVHNMPGGSSLGTYNGVYPAPPAFWDDARLMSLGRGVLRSMMQWFRELPAEARAGVDGFTLLNEPAHMLPDKLETMKRWYVDAVEDYRKLIVAPARRRASRRRAYVNLIETAGWDVDQMADWIGSVFTPEERAEWVVLDVHTYVAWEDPVPGRARCEDGPLVVGSPWRNSRVKNARGARRGGAAQERRREHRRLRSGPSPRTTTRAWGALTRRRFARCSTRRRARFLTRARRRTFGGGKQSARRRAPFLLGLVTLSRGRGRGGRLGAVRVVDVVHRVVVFHRVVDVVHRVRRLRV